MNGLFAVCSQVLVRFRKVSVTKKAVMRRKGRWVSRLEHEVLGAVDVGAFVPGVVPPQHEDEVLAFLRKRANGGVRKRFPPLPLVGAGGVRFDGECGV